MDAWILEYLLLSLFVSGMCYSSYIPLLYFSDI